MAPGQHDVLKAAVWLVDPILGRVDGVVEVGIVLKGTRVDDLIRVCASDDESVADNVPLALGAVEVEELS